MKNRARQRIRSPRWLDERLRRGFGGGIPCVRRALFHKASLRRSRRSRHSPLLRLALWKNSSLRYQSGFFNRLPGVADDVAGVTGFRAAAVAVVEARAGSLGTQPCEELAGGLGTGGEGGREAFAEEGEGRDALEVEIGSDVREGVGIDFGEEEFALGHGGCLCEFRGHHAAGTAPWGPEVDDDGQRGESLELGVGRG